MRHETQFQSTGVMCEAMRPRIVALLDGELASEEAREVIAHLRSCRECEAIRGQYALLLSPSTISQFETADLTAAVQAAITASDATQELAKGRAEVLRLPSVDLQLHSPEKAEQEAQQAATELVQLLGELKTLRGEMQAMRNEMDGLRREIAAVRVSSRIPVRPASPRLFPLSEKGAADIVAP